MPLPNSASMQEHQRLTSRRLPARAGTGATASDPSTKRLWRSAQLQVRHQSSHGPLISNLHAEQPQILHGPPHPSAGIDFFGTNVDLLRDLSTYETLDGQVLTADDYSSEEDSDPYGFEDADMGPSSTAAAQGSVDGASVIPADAQKKIDEQAAYIEALEETNLKLQERIYLLEQDLKKLQGGPEEAGGSGRRSSRAEAGDCSDGDRGMPLGGLEEDEGDEGNDDRSEARGNSPSSDVADAAAGGR